MSESDKSDDASAMLRDLGQYLIDLSKIVNREENNVTSIAIPLPILNRGSRQINDVRILSDIAILEYKERELRSKFFDSSILGEPSWDMLLDLFIARANGLRISITSACIASRVPVTTALRWLTVLENRGLILRSTDHMDKRRSWVELSDLGFNAMSDFLRERSKRRDIRIESYNKTKHSPNQRKN